jgi:hypothetical protein
MFRRCISALVMFGFVAGQLAAVPHAHGVISPIEQRQHDSHPHVHIGHWGHSHDHDHAGSDKHEKSSSRSDEDETCAPIHDHDADAIYLPAAGVVALANGGKQSAASNLRAAVADLAFQPACLASDEVDAPVQCHPPDEGPAGCPLFLILRTLRI